MAKATLNKLIMEAMSILSTQGIVVRRDRAVRTGGCCTLDGNRYVVLGTQLPPESILEVLLEALTFYRCPLDDCSQALRKRYHLSLQNMHPPEGDGQQLQHPHKASPERASHSES
jgi:hypothetical protein